MFRIDISKQLEEIQQDREKMMNMTPEGQPPQQEKMKAKKPEIDRFFKIMARSADQVQEARALVRSGDIGPVRELLYDSALMLFERARKIVMMPVSFGIIDEVAAIKEIFVTLDEHSDTNRLSGIASSLFQSNLEKIMQYISRKGGKVYRYELLTSRVIQGAALDYDKHIAALIDSGYISATQPGHKKEITYSIIPAESPLIEVFASDKADGV